MRIVILAQEEPIFLGPMIMRLMESQRDSIKLVCLGGLRGAAKTPKTIAESIKRLVVYWLIFEPYGFINAIAKRCIWLIFRGFPLWIKLDFYSTERAAKRLRLPVVKINNPNDITFLSKVKSVRPDVIINQSDFILNKELLSIPKTGVISRHGITCQIRYPRSNRCRVRGRICQST